MLEQPCVPQRRLAPDPRNAPWMLPAPRVRTPPPRSWSKLPLEHSCQPPGWPADVFDGAGAALFPPHANSHAAIAMWHGPPSHVLQDLEMPHGIVRLQVAAGRLPQPLHRSVILPIAWLVAQLLCAVSAPPPAIAPEDAHALAVSAKTTRIPPESHLVCEVIALTAQASAANAWRPPCEPLLTAVGASQRSSLHALASGTPPAADQTAPSPAGDPWLRAAPLRLRAPAGLPAFDGPPEPRGQAALHIGAHH
mmetsp:Transcript_44998/g.106879  ORF Transcript_44998/g.106879 Transcript_44998/m.106879 type:complete len:251 (+) Transcript_44998:346-1098(+)